MTVLVGLVVLGTLATATLSIAYVQYSRTLRDLQGEAARANRDWSMFQQLAADAVQYSKDHPKIDRILQEVGINKNKTTSERPSSPAK